MILSLFEFLSRFNTINIYYLVKSYDFTSQLMILTLDTVPMVSEIY